MRPAALLAFAPGASDAELARGVAACFAGERCSRITEAVVARLDRLP